jgi:hypothetical protein
VRPQPGIYRHAKGGFYRVLFSVVDATNGPHVGKWSVVYVCLKYGGTFVRDEDEFNELVTPDPSLGFNEGVKVPRFSFSSTQLDDADAESLYDGLLELVGRTFKE